MTIPILDLLTLGPELPPKLIQDFREAYANTGFAYIVNHGIDPKLIDSVFNASKQFHDLPLTEKLAINLDKNHRGYIAIGTSTDVNTELAEVSKPNQSASFMMMRESSQDPDRYLSGPNQWPDLPGFRNSVETYNQALTRLGRDLMRIALAACQAPCEAIDAFDEPTTWLRLLHYPPMPPQSPEDLYGSAPHTDFGCLTILAQDDIGGLQVMTPEGSWIDAAPMKNAFIVNVGDMLHRMSNGILRSTPHRVINRSGQMRYSCPFFYDPDVAYDVAPLPGTGTAKFEPLNFGEFLKSELEAGYDAHSAVDADNAPTGNQA